MKTKIPRRPIDVNVEGLDRIIDNAKSTSLRESDSEKLKTALHALAEKLLPQPKTEKTSAIFGDAKKPAPEDIPPEAGQTVAGHGRNGADTYRSADKIRVTHAAGAR
jgi:hypothetical protein